MTKAVITIAANSEVSVASVETPLPVGEWVPEMKSLKALDSLAWLSCPSQLGPTTPPLVQPELLGCAGGLSLEGPSKLSSSIAPGPQNSAVPLPAFLPKGAREWLDGESESDSVKPSSRLCADAPDFSPSNLSPPPDFGLPLAPHRQPASRSYEFGIPPLPWRAEEAWAPAIVPGVRPISTFYPPLLGAFPAAAGEKGGARDRHAQPSPPPGVEGPVAERRGEMASQVPIDRIFNKETSTYSVHWRVDAGRLEKRDAHMLSPTFDLAFDGEARFARVPFRIVIFPNSGPGGVQQMKGHRNFRQSQGQGCIQLKCEAEATKVPAAKIHLRFFVGAENSPDRQVARDVADHNFSASAAHNFGPSRDAPDGGADWNFKAAVAPSTDFFLVTLEVMPVEAATVVDRYQYQ